jgi:hypothetical protein
MNNGDEVCLTALAQAIAASEPSLTPEQLRQGLSSKSRYAVQRLSCFNNWSVEERKNADENCHSDIRELPGTALWALREVFDG